MPGHLIAFEGLDQSGKQTQAELLRDRLKQEGRKARLVSFPDYATSIGEELARALQGEREYGPDVMQLLYVANRYERKPDLLRWLEGGLILVCDRYVASSIAYGEAQGLDGAWLARFSDSCRRAALTHRPRHRARKPRSSGRRSIAIGTSATCRCRRASVKATSSRPPTSPGAGLSSTASAPWTKSPLTCSTRWRHDSRCRKRATSRTPGRRSALSACASQCRRSGFSTNHASSAVAKSITMITVKTGIQEPAASCSNAASGPQAPSPGLERYTGTRSWSSRAWSRRCR